MCVHHIFPGWSATIRSGIQYQLSNFNSVLKSHDIGLKISILDIANLMWRLMPMPSSDNFFWKCRTAEKHCNCRIADLQLLSYISSKKDVYSFRSAFFTLLECFLQVRNWDCRYKKKLLCAPASAKNLKWQCYRSRTAWIGYQSKALGPDVSILKLKCKHLCWGSKRIFFCHYSEYRISHICDQAALLGELRRRAVTFKWLTS